MPNRDPKDLEAFVHRALRELPEHRAPRSLESRVMASLAARRNVPWWQRGWQAWPLVPRTLVIAGGAGAAAALAWVAWNGSQAADEVSASGWLATHLPGLAAARSVLGTLAEAGGAVVQHYQAYLLGALVVIAGAYVAAVGIGASLYRFFAVNSDR